MNTLATMAVTAAVVGGLFKAIGWFTKDHPTDRILRGGLDKLVTRLDNIPLRDVGPRVIARFITKWDETFGGLRGLGVFLVLSLVGNVLVLLFTAAPAKPPLEYALVGLLPDVFFGRLSVPLMRWAIKKPDRRLSLALGVDIWLLFVAVATNFLLVGILVGNPGVQGIPWYFPPFGVLALPIGGPAFVISNMQGRAWALLPTASVQTATYVTLVLIALLLRAIPRRLQSILSHGIYRVTTDDAPVFTQLGKLAAAISALVVGLTNLR